MAKAANKTMMFSLNTRLEYSGFDKAYHDWASDQGSNINIGDEWPALTLASAAVIQKAKEKITQYLNSDTFDVVDFDFGQIYGDNISCQSVMKLSNKKGEVTGVTLLLFVTPEDHPPKYTDEDMLYLELVAKNVQNAVVITDDQKRVIYVNQAFEKLAGYSFAEVEGRKLSMLQGEKTSPEKIKELNSGLKKKIPFSIELINYHKSGRTYWVEIYITPIFDDRGQLIRYIGIQNNITERRELHELSQKNEAEYLSVFNSLHEGVVVQDLDDKIILANDSAASILGLSKDQLMGKDSYDPRWKALNHDGRPLDPQKHPSNVTLKTGKPVTGFMMNVYAGDDIRRVIKINSEPIRDSKNKLIGVVASFLDITEQKQTEDKLLETNRLLELAVDTAGLGIWTYDVEMEKLHWNNVLHAIYNISQETFNHRFDDWTNKLHHEDTSRVIEEFDQVSEGKNVSNVIFRILPSTDTIRYIQASGKPITNSNGKITKLVGINVDITDFIEKEEKLQQALDAKNTLLKELHHRIKNNLNLISNLLYFKSKITKDQALLDYIKETRTRINTIAKTHDLLLKMEEFDQLDTKKYLEELVNSLIASYTTDGSKYQVSFDIEPLKLSVDKILIIGLLTNEIILNTIKYAYEPGKGGPVSVSLVKERSSLILTIYDEGKGFKAGTSKNIDTTGLNLISMMVKQLKGSFKQETSKGVKYIIGFPHSAPSKNEKENTYH